MKRLINYCLLICITLNAFAVSHKMNCHSKTVMRDKQLFVLNVQNRLSGPKLYFIKNIANVPIWLNHPLTQDPSAQAGWASYLEPHHFSALLLNRKNFSINCATITSNKTNVADCNKVISVCQSTSTLDPALSGNYWFIENQPENLFFGKVQKRLKQTTSANE